MTKVMYSVGKRKEDYDILHSFLKDARRLKKHLGKDYHIYKTDPKHKSKKFGDFKWIKVE